MQGKGTKAIFISCSRFSKTCQTIWKRKTYSRHVLKTLHRALPSHFGQSYAYSSQLQKIQHYILRNKEEQFYKAYSFKCVPGIVVGITTGYGLNSPGIESRLWRDFPYLSRPALGHTQPPVQWVPSLSRG